MPRVRRKVKIKKAVAMKGQQGFLPGNTGGGGRPLGAKNKITKAFTTLKQAFLDAFNDERVGGVEGLVLWILKSQDNRKDFYKLVTKMLPRTLDVQSPDAISPGNLNGLKDEELDSVLIGLGKALEKRRDE